MPAPGTNGKIPHSKKPCAGMRNGMAAMRDTMQTNVDEARVAVTGVAPQ